MPNVRPEPTEYFEYYETYVKLVPETDVMAVLSEQLKIVRDVLDPLPADQANVLHEPYTWTIKQVVGHCVDTERVFGYRASRFAADDPTSLPGFDQDMIVANMDYDAVELGDLLNELEHLRNGNLVMFKRMTPECWSRSGIGDGKKMTVRSVAYILAGHIRHHFAIVQKRLG